MNVNNDHFLDRAKLEQLLEKAIVSSHNYKIMIDSFYKKLNSIVRDTYQQEWSCTHFLGLLSGFAFYDYYRYEEYERTYKENNENLTRRNISPANIAKLALRDTLKLFDILMENYLCHEYKMPIAWLYQAISFLLSDDNKKDKALIASLNKAYNNIKIAILSVKYDLQINFNLELENQSISLNIKCINEDKTNITYNAEQATGFLNKELDEVYKPHKIIELCLNSEVFHAYLHRDKYQPHELTGSSVSALCHQNHLDDIITNANIYSSYPHPYSSLLRISKYDTNSKTVLETLALGNDIHFQSSNNNSIWLEESLFEKICEKSAYTGLSSSKKIVITDIFFRQEELQRYAKQVK